MGKKLGRPRKHEVAVKRAAAVSDERFTDELGVSHRINGSHSIDATIEVLRALTRLPTDRSKARVLRFVQDYFDEQHGH